MSVKAFVDSNIFIYLHDVTAGRKRERAKQLVEKLWDSGEGCVSVQVLQEFYVNSTRKLGMPQGEAEAQVVRLSAWTVHTPSAHDVVAAIRLHQSEQLSFWDAMIVQSVRQLGCHILYSEDLNPGQTVAGVVIQNPFR
ncbi:MAG: PIN domain-containing protein [Truepera sp.]|nr:PIN domain-containing protein [Truepera sp.]